jgi:hypothetical protein
MIYATKSLLTEKSFDEILAPFRRNIEDSGMSDEELEDLFTDVRKDASRARKERMRGDGKIPCSF